MMLEVTTEEELRALPGRPRGWSTRSATGSTRRTARGSRAAIATWLERPDDSLEELERYCGPAYAESLY